MTPPRAPTLLRAVVYLAILFALLLGVAEFALWGLGLGDPSGQLSLSRGFSAEDEYLVPDADVPGAYRTQLFDENKDAYEVTIPPKGARRRVLMLGGSNTQMMPGATLEALLNRAAGGDLFEVVNLGRFGYGSERVAILAQQARVLEPDALVVYSGHNEFIERAFLAELEELGWGGRLEGLTALRTVNVLTSLIRRVSGAAGTPQRRVRVSLPYETTLRYFDAYRDNLERICSVAGDDVPVVLCTVVANTVFAPFLETLTAEVTGENAVAFRQAVTRGRLLFPEPIRRANWPAVIPRAEDWLRGGVDEGPGTTDGAAAFAQDATVGAAPAGDDGASASDVGDAPVPFIPRPLHGLFAAAPPRDGAEDPWPDGALWPAPERWTPLVRELLTAYELLIRPDLDAQTHVALGRALLRFDEALAIAPDHPGALHGKGLALLLLGRVDEGVATLDAAARYDRAPQRGNEVSNGIVRDVAARLPNVTLYDAEAAVRASCPDRLVGYEVMMDYCHLQPGARAALLREIVDVVVEVTDAR